MQGISICCTGGRHDDCANIQMIALWFRDDVYYDNKLRAIIKTPKTSWLMVAECILCAYVNSKQHMCSLPYDSIKTLKLDYGNTSF